MTTAATIFVRLQVPGWHRWDGAPPHRDYLAHPHRHTFHIEARMQVRHDDREVEFHDVIDRVRGLLKQLAPGGDFGGQSCERIAAVLGRALACSYDRACQVTVSEDDECGATVDVAAPQR